MDAESLRAFFPWGYLATVAIETPILLLGLSAPHVLSRRLFAGLWLTACTYPIVILVLPLLFAADQRWLYLCVAETFAPLAECLLFAAAFHVGRNVSRAARWRDYAAITLANLGSFGLGEIWWLLSQRWA